MKKILLLLAMILMSKGLMAQSGALRINNTSWCTVYLTMYMKGASSGPGNGLACALVSCTYIVAPFSGIFFPTPGSFISAAGLCLWTSPVAASYWVAPTDFYWTDVEFQWGCEGCSGGGPMSESGTTNCFLAGSTYPGPCGQMAKWLSSTPGSAMSDVTLFF